MSFRFYTPEMSSPLPQVDSTQEKFAMLNGLGRWRAVFGYGGLCREKV